MYAMDAIFSCFLYFRILYIEKNIGGKIGKANLLRNRFSGIFCLLKCRFNLLIMYNTII